MKRSLHAALPSIDSLIIFEQAAHYLSFTKAGAHLGLTQSAVSRQIIDLEALLEVELFSRERQRLQLTAAGAEFRGLVQPVIQDLRSATLRMQTPGAQSHVLNVSVAASFCNLWFIPNLPGYYAQENAAQVNLVPHVGPVVFGAGAMDAAIVNADRPPENCEYVKFIDMEVAPYAAASLLHKLQVRDLDGFERIPAVDLREVRGTWPRYLAHVGLSHMAIDLLGSHSLLLLNYEAALAGLGVVLMPPEFVIPGEQPGGLVPLHSSLMPVGRSYFFCWPALSRKPDAVHSLRAWLQREVAQARQRRSRIPQALRDGTRP